MQAKYDAKAKALYITLQSGKVARTIKLRDDVLVDVGNDNGVLGIELLNPTSDTTKELMTHPTIPVKIV